jgi:hypothetical protein
MRRGFQIAIAVLAGAAPLAQAQDANSLIQKLKSQFTLTQTTANGSDIVTAGSILVLQKDRLVMYALSNPAPPRSTYKRGRISKDFGLGGALVNNMTNPNQAAPDQRMFVAGEKFWVIAIGAVKDGVVFKLYSDPYGDVRYWGELKFPFAKGSVPAADELLNTIAEVLTVQPPDNAAAPTAQPPAAPEAPPAPATPAEATPAALPPPPPPPPDPKTISLGQTKDEVVATFGQPRKIVNLGAKVIYYYPDMKVTLLNGKVSDVADISAEK